MLTLLFARTEDFSREEYRALFDELSEERRALVRSIASPIEARLALLGEGLSRRALARLLRVPPRSVPIEREPGGKPVLTGEAGSRIAFNYSHTVVCGKGRLLLAIATPGGALEDDPPGPAPGAPPITVVFPDGTPVREARTLVLPEVWAAAGELAVGCDIQAPRAPREALARKVCTPAERVFLDGRGEDELPMRFSLVWSAKEALAKCTGEGLARPFREIETCAPNGDPLPIVAGLPRASLLLGGCAASVASRGM